MNTEEFAQKPPQITLNLFKELNKKSLVLCVNEGFWQLFEKIDWNYYPYCPLYKDENLLEMERKIYWLIADRETYPATQQGYHLWCLRN